MNPELYSPNESELIKSTIGQFIDARIQPEHSFRFDANLMFLDFAGMPPEYAHLRLPARLRIEVRWTDESGRSQRS